MGNVIYLLGAGASALNSRNANIPMPLANQFQSTIVRMKESFGYNKYIIENSEFKKYDMKFDMFSEYILNHNTIDEGMRKLYINGETPRFSEYKKLIQLIFYFVETIENYRDSRYIQFLLTAVNDNKKLPDSLKILSWNYDNQLEYAAKEIDLHFVDETLSELNYFKINALRESDYLQYNNNPITDELKIKFIRDIVNNDKDIIQFAWEKKESSIHRFREQKMIEFINAIEVTKEDCVVSIGYSFPYVNHAIDRVFFKKISPKKVYIQDINPILANSLKERFGLINTEFIPISNCDRFYIPNELYI